MYELGHVSKTSLSLGFQIYNIYLRNIFNMYQRRSYMKDTCLKIIYHYCHYFRAYVFSLLKQKITFLQGTVKYRSRLPGHLYGLYCVSLQIQPCNIYSFMVFSLLQEILFGFWRYTLLLCREKKLVKGGLSQNNL